MNPSQFAAVLVLAAAAGAQSFTSPRGYATVEGGGTFAHVLASTDALRWQQIDATVRGAPAPNLGSIAWRRDGQLADNAAYGARVVQQMSVVLAHSTLATIDRDFARNYRDQPVVVFTPKNVNAPDWTRRPAAAPAPFDFRLTFDQQWSYNGTDDLLWEVRVAQVSGAPGAVSNYPFDFQPMTGSFSLKQDGVALGTGCIAKGQTTRRFFLQATLYDHGTSFRLRHSTHVGPRAAPVVTFLDVQDQNQTIPGLCAPLRAAPTVILGLGTASAGGAVPAVEIANIPYDAAALGRNVYAQAAGLDDSQAGIQVAVSQGERVTVPANPTLPGTGRVFCYSVLGATTVQGPWGGGVIAEFQP